MSHRSVWLADKGPPGCESPGLRHGRGVFTSLRVSGGRGLRLDRHFQRLCAGAERLGLRPPEPASFQAGLQQLDHRGLEGIVRAQLAAGAEGQTHFWLSFEELALSPPPVWQLWLAQGGHWPQRPSAGIKSFAWLDHWLLARAAREAGADEAVLLTAAGQVAEGCRSNLFVVRAGRARTPPVSLGILAGIAREMLLEHPLVEVADLDRADLEAADEVFASNAVRGVVACRWRHLEPGPVSAALQQWMQRRWELEAVSLASPPACAGSGSELP